MLASNGSIAGTKAALDDYLFQQTGGVVQSGPFKGMKLLRETAWKEARLAPQILGCYEEELHGELEHQIKRLSALTNPVIGVVGSAEGYYPIGLKRRLPSALAFAVDPDEKANALCKQAAEFNGVGVDINPPVNLVMEEASLLILDCEGHEVAYLDPERFPALVEKHIIVEIHNVGDQKTDQILLDRFRGTHRINMVLEGPRNPNQYKELCALSNDQRWLAVSENRPCLMAWFVMKPKGVVVK